MSEFEQKVGSSDLIQLYRNRVSGNLDNLKQLFEDYFGENGRGENLPQEHQSVVRSHAKIYTFYWSRPEEVIWAQRVRNPELKGRVDELIEELNIEPWDKIREDLRNLQLNGRKEASLDSRAHHLASKAILNE